VSFLFSVVVKTAMKTIYKNGLDKPLT